ncbi:hypothetical protein HK097_008455 [Rhizophlyctis rosea]|uniref:Prominin-like protein n=1 Tax=Rhizophlyctis rosea TaxID=64517 RepID=A0AAD5X9F9_9FUNG|nr:hypothetical protein HK097_008455 [Rhizophlyctis rosea]
MRLKHTLPLILAWLLPLLVITTLITPLRASSGLVPTHGISEPASPQTQALTSHVRSLQRRGTVEDFLRGAAEKGNQTRSPYYAPFTHPEMGYWVYTGIGYYIRMGLRSGQKHIPLVDIKDREMFGGIYKAPDYMTVLKYYIPVLIFIATLLFTCVSLCCTGCCLCCCPGNRLSRRQKDPYTFRQRVTSVALTTLIYTCWIGAIIGGIRGTFYMHDVLNAGVEFPNKAFDSLSDLSNSFSPGVRAAIGALSVDGIDKIIAKLPDIINLSPVKEDFVPQILVLSDGLKDTDDKLTLVKNAAGAVDAAVLAISNALTAIQTDLTSLDAKISTLNAAHNVPGGGGATYTLDPQIGSVSSGVSGEMTNAQQKLDADKPNPPALNQINSKITISPLTLANKASDVASTIVDKVQGEFDTAVAGARNDVKTKLNQLEADILQQIEDFGVDKYINDAKADYLPMINDYAPEGPKYYKYGQYGLWVFFALPGIVLLVIALAIMTRSPKGVKCCIVGMIPMILIFIFFCIFIIVITVLLGDVCTVALDRTSVPPPLDILVSAYVDPDKVSLIPTVFEALDVCGGGHSIVEVALMYKDVFQDQLGFDVSAVDISVQAKDYIDDFQIPDISGQIDITQFTTDFDTAAIKQSIQTAQNDVNAFSTSDVQNLKSTSIQSIRNKLDTAYTYLSGSAFPKQYSSPQSPALQTASDNDFLQIRDNSGILAQLTTMRSTSAGSITALENAIDGLVAAVTALKSQVGGLVTDVGNVADGFDALVGDIDTFVGQIGPNITNSRDSLVDILWLAVDSAKVAMYGETSCQGVAVQVYNAETIMCEGLPTSLDNYWLALFIVVSFGTMAVPTFTGAANILADSGAGAPAEPPEKKGKKGKKKGGKDSAAEAGQHNWYSPGSKMFQSASKSASELPNKGLKDKEEATVHPVQITNIQKSNIMTEPSPITTRPQAVIPDYDETAPSPSEIDAASPTHLLAHTRYNPTIADVSVEEMRPSWMRPSQAAGGASHHDDAIYSRHPHIPQYHHKGYAASIHSHHSEPSAPPFPNSYDSRYANDVKKRPQEAHPRPQYGEAHLDPHGGYGGYGNAWDQTVPQQQVYPPVPDLPEHLQGYSSPPGFGYGSDDEYHPPPPPPM